MDKEETSMVGCGLILCYSLGMAQLQPKNKRNPAEHLKEWQFKPGQSGNMGGRPTGAISMKVRAANYLATLDDKEARDFLKGMNKTDVWKMAEGNPANATDLTSKGEQILIVPAELIEKNVPTPGTEPNS